MFKLKNIAKVVRKKGSQESNALTEAIAKRQQKKDKKKKENFNKERVFASKHLPKIDDI